METSVSHMVLGLRHINGWLTMLEEHFGKEFSEKCEAYDEALIAGSAAAKKFWYEIERPKVRKSLQAWMQEPEMVTFATECRERREKQLNETLSKAKEKLVELVTHGRDPEKKKAFLESIKKMERMMKSGITPEKILQAEEYPIDKIINVNQNQMAKCVNHDDTNPSMNCKNNFAYCHACGYHANAIGLYMKVNNVGFKEAVNTLSL